MKKIFLLFLPVLMLCCCEDDAIPQPPTPPACLEVVCETEEEFFGKAIMNGECWIADFVAILPEHNISIGKFERDGIGERLRINLTEETDLQDTIWLGRTHTAQPAPNIVSSYYTYSEGHSIAGTFNFPVGAEPTYEDFVLIDYFNADTSIIEGRFQVHFPVRSVNTYVNAPDTMRLGCGSFRVKRE